MPKSLVLASVVLLAAFEVSCTRAVWVAYPDIGLDFTGRKHGILPPTFSEMSVAPNSTSWFLHFPRTKAKVWPPRDFAFRYAGKTWRLPSLTTATLISLGARDDRGSLLLQTGDAKASFAFRDGVIDWFQYEDTSHSSAMAVIYKSKPELTLPISKRTMVRTFGKPPAYKEGLSATGAALGFAWKLFLSITRISPITD